MRQLMVTIVYKLFKTLADAYLTAPPRDMETVNSNLEGVKPVID